MSLTLLSSCGVTKTIPSADETWRLKSTKKCPNPQDVSIIKQRYNVTYYNLNNQMVDTPTVIFCRLYIRFSLAGSDEATQRYHNNGNLSDKIYKTITN
jgi:hypothetical protein